jgi:glycosyltransferase involved in cell wall biosynthesis
MVSGRPVLSSNLPPMPEFGNDAVLYFDPRRPEDLALRLRELLDNPQDMKALGRRGIEQAARYDWGVTARATRDALASLAGASVAQ